MQHDFNLLAGGGQVIDVSGKFFKYKSGLGAIRVRDNRGGFIDLLPGQGVNNTEYNGLIVQDISGAANSGVLLAGGFDFTDDRISGTVDVVDGGKTRTKGGIAFAGSILSAALAANYSFSQLANPAGSGKNLFIEQIGVQTSGTAGLTVGFMAATLGAAGPDPLSKKAGGATGVGKLYQGNQVGFLAGIYGLLNGNIWTPKEPLMLPPGYVCFVRGNQVNQDAQGAFEYFEEVI